MEVNQERRVGVQGRCSSWLVVIVGPVPGVSRSDVWVGGVGRHLQGLAAGGVRRCRSLHSLEGGPRPPCCGRWLVANAAPSDPSSLHTLQAGVAAHGSPRGCTILFFSVNAVECRLSRGHCWSWRPTPITAVPPFGFVRFESVHQASVPFVGLDSSRLPTTRFLLAIKSNLLRLISEVVHLAPGGVHLTCVLWAGPRPARLTAPSRCHAEWPLPSILPTWEK